MVAGSRIQKPGGGGAEELLRTIDLASLAANQAVITEGFTADYWAVRLLLLTPRHTGTGPTKARLQLSSDGGATWDSGASDYGQGYTQAGWENGAASDSAAGQSGIGFLLVANRVDADQADHHFASATEILIVDPLNAAQYTPVRWEGVETYQDTGLGLQGYYRFDGAGARKQEAAHDAARLFTANGNNWVAGTLHVYGVKAP